jgi:two-component system, cell cycle sensor histidine kinase and response regulator CckA
VTLTDRTASEDALRASEHRYRELFEESPISLWEEDFSAVKTQIDELRAAGVTDLSSYFAAHPEAVLECARLVKIVQVNQATVELAEGTSEEEFLANLGDTFTSETYDLFAQELVALAAGQTRFAGETVGKTLRGRVVNYTIQLSVAPGAKDTWSKVLISVSEITERKRAEEALRAAEAKYRTLVEQLPLVTYAVDLKSGAVIYVSPQIEELLGYPAARWLSENEGWYSALHPDDRDSVLAATKLAHVESKAFSGEYRLVASNESVVWVRDEATIVRDERGRPLFAQGFLLDISDRQRAQEDHDRLESELRQAQRLEAIGRLAGGVAHDFNNVLAAIIGFAKLLLRELPADSPQRERAEHIARAGDRAAALTQQLLAFSRRQLLTPQVLNLNDVIGDVRLLLERLIGEDIRLEVVLDPQLGNVKADPGQLAQVILNLAVNARDAMPTGGRLLIKTMNVDTGDPDPVGNGDRNPRAGVAFSISDTGHGMDESTQAQAFDPFFTTKETGKGTGLGLATVYGIVTQSGGTIHVDSTPGQGTTFTIQLPRTQSPAVPATGSGATTEESLDGSETILLVEDDDDVRAFVKDVLEQHGYRVLVAALPSEAIAIAARWTAEIDVLLTDVVMPEMSGRELCEALAAGRPTMRTLYMSGYTDEALGHHGVLGEQFALIGKPFTAAALARRLREIVEGAENNTLDHELGHP